MSVFPFYYLFKRTETFCAETFLRKRFARKLFVRKRFARKRFANAGLLFVRRLRVRPSSVPRIGTATPTC